MNRDTFSIYLLSLTSIYFEVETKYFLEVLKVITNEKSKQVIILLHFIAQPASQGRFATDAKRLRDSNKKVKSKGQLNA